MGTGEGGFCSYLILLRCADVNIFLVTHDHQCIILSCDLSSCLSSYCFIILLVAYHVDYIWIMHGVDILISSFQSHVVGYFLCWAFVLIPIY